MNGSEFNGHAIVKNTVTSDYYDPSFGSIRATDANEWEKNALDGFGSVLTYNDGSSEYFINWIGHLNDSSPQSKINP